MNRLRFSSFTRSPGIYSVMRRVSQISVQMNVHILVETSCNRNGQNFLVELIYKYMRIGLLSSPLLFIIIIINLVGEINFKTKL